MSNSNHQAPRQIRSIRNTVIDPFKQLKIGLYVIIVTVFFLVLSGVLFYNTFSEQYNNVLEIFNVTDPDSKWQIISNDVFYSNLWKLSLLFVIFIIVLLSVISYSTHKYYGPLMSFERFSKSIASGKYYSRVQVRKKDELKSLATQLNSMAAALEKKHGSLVDAEGNSVRRRKADKNNQNDITQKKKDETLQNDSATHYNQKQSKSKSNLNKTLQAS